MEKLSIVILTWNSEADIKPCLDSLITSLEGIKYEIILVDNGSTDNTLEIIETYFLPHIQLISNQKNLGVSRARNQALHLVSGDAVLILDIDTIVNKEALSSLIQCMENDPKVGLCACKLRSLSGEVQLSCRKLPTLRYKIFNILASKNIHVSDNQSQFYEQEMQGDTPFEVEYVIGACQLIRKSALNTVGLLDEHIFYGPEDADFCLRMKLAGWKVVYIPTVSIIHHYQQLTTKKMISVMSWKHTKALIYYFWKHRKTNLRLDN